MTKQFTFTVEPMGKTKRGGSHRMFKGVGPDGAEHKPMVTISRSWWEKMGNPENFKVTLSWD